MQVTPTTATVELMVGFHPENVCCDGCWALTGSQNGKLCEDDTYARLRAERELNARLKDKLVEMLLGV